MDRWKMPWDPHWLDEWSAPKPKLNEVPDSPCLHDGCPKCHGTGKSDSGFCVHHISCPCPKCTIMC